MMITYYDPITFIRKGTVPKAKSVTWNKRFYETGSLEISLKSTDIACNDLIIHGNNCGIVMEIEEILPDGVIIYGYDLKGLAEFRYITEAITYENQTPEYIMKDLATRFFLTGERMITGFLIEENSGNGNTIDTYTVEEGFLSEAFTRISKKYDIGYDIIFDENNIIFCTEYATENHNVTFSRRHHNIEQAVYTHSIFNTYNAAYAKDDEGNIVSSGVTEGILRREGFTGKSAELEGYLAEKKEVENITAQASQKVVFGLDYRMGDIVNVSFGDLQTQQIISGVEFQYEKGIKKIYPVFGTEKQNPIKKIMKG